MRRQHRYFIGTSLILLALSLISWLIISTSFIYEWERYPHKVFIAFGALLVAVILTSVTLYRYGPGVRTATKTMQGWWMLAPLLALISFAVFSLYVVAPSPSGLDIKWLSSVGAIFVVVMAGVTAGGFLLTVTRLEEIHGRILSYPHLLERLDALVDLEEARVKGKGKNKPGRLYIFANAPAIGNVSAPDEFARCWPQLIGLLSDPRVDVKIACLPWEEDIQGTSAIHRFYQEHWGSLVPKNELIEKVKESFEIIDIVKKAKSEHKPTRPKELFYLKDTVHEVPFHLFLTSDRAILFTALSFPDYALDGLEDNGKSIEDDRREVKVVGFETGDRSIIDALKKGFERRLHKIAFKAGTVDEPVVPGQSQEDSPCEIPVNGRSLRGLIRSAEASNRWVVLCRGLTGGSERRTSLDELADVLARRGWSSLRFDYGNSLNPSGGESLRTVASMVEDVAAAVEFLSRRNDRNPDVVIARGFGSRVALEALTHYPDIPLIMWAPILWLRTSLELRARLHELRRRNRLMVDGREICTGFLDSLDDPTDEQVRGWVTPRRHFIIQGEDDQVTPTRFAFEAKELIKSAEGNVELITVLGTHPHPGMDVTIQIGKISKVLSEVAKLPRNNP